MKIHELTKPGELRSWLEDTVREGVEAFALDLETTGLGKTDSIISAAVTGPGEHIAFFGPELLPELLSAPSGVRFVFHNASFDLKFLSWAGVPLHEHYEYSDTLILSHLHDENGEHGLGALAKRYYGTDYKEEFWSKYKKAEDAPKEALAAYNAQDVYYTLRMYELLRDSLARDAVPESLVLHVHRLQASLLETEIAGLAVDRDYLLQKGVELKTRLAEIIPKLRACAPDEIAIIECDEWVKKIESYKTPKHRAKVKRPEFNWNSNKQLLRLFYDELKLPVQLGKSKKDKKTGQYSKKKPAVDAEALQVLKELHPVADQLRYFRAFDKAYGTYVEGILQKMVNGRIYPSFNVAGTDTGRISHADPNMGNLPSAKKSKELDEPFLAGLRGMFIPDPGNVLISADFSQLEVCLSAHFTQDKNLLRIVNEGVSQHDITAEGLGIPRNQAKTLNFALQYGASAKKVSAVLRLDAAGGQKQYDKYWETYQGQKRVMDECAARVDRGEPIISPFGRRRRFEVRKRQSWDSAYRQAWNALVQGTGSDCTSRSFYLCDEALRAKGIGRALFTVHDEILIQAKEEHAEEAQAVLLECMAAVGREIGLTVALKAQGSGPMRRWED